MPTTPKTDETPSTATENMDYGKYYDKDYFHGATKSNYSDYAENDTHRGRAYDIKRKFPDAITILDVGCAYGYVVKYLREMGYEAFGCDVSEYAISQSVCPEYCKVGSVTDLPYKQKFDLVISTDVLEHLHNDDVAKAVSELKRVGTMQDHAVSTWNGKTDEEHQAIHEIQWWEERLAGCSPSNYSYYEQCAKDFDYDKANYPENFPNAVK